MYLKFPQSTLETSSIDSVFSSGGQSRRVNFGGIALLINRGHLRLHFRRREGARKWLARSDISIQGDTWVHVAGTWSLDGGVKLYLNGVLNDIGREDTYTLEGPHLPNTMYVGRVNTTEENYGNSS